MRPAIPLPMRDGLLVPLQRAAFRLLAAPPEGTHQFPDMRRVVGHVVLLLDHATNPLQGPEVGGVAGRQRALQQQPDHALLLGERQLCRATRGGPWPKPFHAMPTIASLPPKHRADRGLYRAGDLRQIVPVLHQLDGAPATLLQLAGSTVGAHASYDT